MGYPRVRIEWNKSGEHGPRPQPLYLQHRQSSRKESSLYFSLFLLLYSTLLSRLLTLFRYASNPIGDIAQIWQSETNWGRSMFFFILFCLNYC